MITTPAIPLYQCHKQVRALKIKSVTKHAHPDPNADDAAFEASPEFQGAHLHPEDEAFAPIAVDAAWYRKHDPMPGGYYVVYEDGYTSFSPAEAFDGGYALAQAQAAPVKTAVVLLADGAIVKVNGIPVELGHDTWVRVAPGNVPLMFA